MIEWNDYTNTLGCTFAPIAFSKEKLFNVPLFTIHEVNYDYFTGFVLSAINDQVTLDYNSEITGGIRAWSVEECKELAEKKLLEARDKLVSMTA